MLKRSAECENLDVSVFYIGLGVVVSSRHLFAQ
jgi:hypothetical protein